jgi:hypothetical protein
VLRTGFVKAFSYRQNPFDRLRANGLINNPESNHVLKTS